jgi:AcrR family transcriptional regulator
VTVTERSYHHGDLRRTLVATGLELCRRDGIDALGLREITRAVGVSPNAAYRHFPNRHTLVLAIALEAQQQLARHIAAAMSSHTPKGEPAERAVARLRNFGLGYIGFALVEPGWYQLACYTQHATDADTPILDDAEPVPSPHHLLLDALSDLVNHGVLTRERRKDAEWVYWSAVEGFTELATTGPLQSRSPPHLTRLATRTLNTVIAGLRTAR